MSHITFLPGEPDPTLPRFLPSFGLDVSHLYLPDAMSNTTWGDQAGSLTLSRSGSGTSVIGSENGVPYVHANGTKFMTSVIVPSQEMVTTILVWRPEATDTADGAAYLFNGGNTGISANAGTAQVYSAPGTSTLTLPSFNKWYCLALVASGTAPVRMVADNQEAVGTAATSDRVGNAIRLFGGASSTRQAKIALALTSPANMSTAQLQGTVFPRVREWLAGLDFATR